MLFYRHIIKESFRRGPNEIVYHRVQKIGSAVFDIIVASRPGKVLAFATSTGPDITNLTSLLTKPNMAHLFPNTILEAPFRHDADELSRLVKQRYSLGGVV